jgi:hypothetical protein
MAYPVKWYEANLIAYLIIPRYVVAETDIMIEYLVPGQLNHRVSKKGLTYIRYFETYADAREAIISLYREALVNSELRVMCDRRNLTRAYDIPEEEPA